MNKVMFSISATVVSSLFVASTVSAELQGVSIDEIDSGLGIGTTYQIYLDVEAGDQVNAIFGDSVDLLSISGVDGAQFYQNAYGGNTSQAINAAFIPIFPSLEYDSFVTIGLTNSTGN
ncbi:MAG: hypothetical protein VX436_01440, partial [Planctomycetota bacterium]|nr:hypothetical protein [Planctomycetota bacterium]